MLLVSCQPVSQPRFDALIVYRIPPPVTNYYKTTSHFYKSLDFLDFLKILRVLPCSPPPRPWQSSTIIHPSSTQFDSNFSPHEWINTNINTWWKMTMIDYDYDDYDDDYDDINYENYELWIYEWTNWIHFCSIQNSSFVESIQVYTLSTLVTLVLSAEGAGNQLLSFRPKAAEMIEDSLQAISGARQVLDDADRWSVPPPESPVDSSWERQSQRAHAPSPHSTYEILWAVAA